MISLRFASALLALGLLASPLADSGKPGGGKPGPGGTKPPPNPDIVYMSQSSRSMTGAAIRGVTLATGVDTELQRSMDGRSAGSVSWSPDGTHYAWIDVVRGQTSSIFVAAPGQAPTSVYSANWGDATKPFPDGFNSDRLVWGPGCNSGDSVLVFQGFGGPNASPQGIYAIDNPFPVGAPPQARKVHDAIGAGAFALSSDGQYLAFDRGHGTNEKVVLLPLCPEPGAAISLLQWNDLGAAEYRSACDDDPTTAACPCNGDPAKICVDYPGRAVQSIDWSGDGSRLALSVVVGPDPDYPWRDMRVAYLDAGKRLLGVTAIDLKTVFGDASSEHSPQWGPTPVGECLRMAFSQSAGASDGSDMNGRRLFLLDVPGYEGSNTCEIVTPVEMAARNPRAIDWKR